MTENKHKGGRLPQVPETYWRDFIDLPEFPRLDEDIQVDVVIVGGISRTDICLSVSK